MKTAWKIFRRDVGRLVRNPAALLVLLGVAVLPSLYAWFNIGANMDPYANTAGVKVAVVNLDEGASVQGMDLNAGDQIVANLRGDHQLGWVFTGKADALEQVRSGDCYAAIVIPSNFSRHLLSVLSGRLETPQLDYYINEKRNAIAPKIAGTGASTIQTQINNTFSAVAAQEVSQLVKQTAGRLSEDVAEAEGDLFSAVGQTRRTMEDYARLLERFRRSAQQAGDLIQGAQKTTGEVEQAAVSGAEALDSAQAALEEARAGAGDFAAGLSRELSQGELLLGKLNGTLSAGLTALEGKGGSVNQSLADALHTVQGVCALNGEILQDMQALLDRLAPLPGSDAGLLDGLREQIDRLAAQNQEDQALLASLAAGNESVGDALQVSADTREKISAITAENTEQVQRLRALLEEELLPQLSGSLDTFATLTGEMKGLLQGVPAAARQVSALLEQMDQSLQTTAAALGRTETALASVEDRLEGVQADLTALASSEALEKLLDLEGVDAQAVSSFALSPVEIQQESFYPVANYGSAMLPFYTNLAVWVGGIILVAILRMEVGREDRRISPAAGYFGRWLLFVVLAVIQGVIVCLGDVLLPGAQCAHPAALVLAGAVCSFAYVNIIYALSLTFKHIGKALCVILVILQIPGSSGTYPVEMTPAFFQGLHPLLPFTYGVGAMRECVAGLYGGVYRRDLLVLLLVYVPLSLFIGLVVRPRLAGVNDLFDQKLGQTQLMVCEPAAPSLSRRTKLSLLLKAALSAQELQVGAARRARAFEKNYRRLVRLGFLALLVIPLVFLVLMFSLESKIVFLTLWIVSVVLIVSWLIVVEFIHTRLAEEQKLAGMSFAEMLEAFREQEDRG